jgi:hypothetical protein
MVTLINLRPAIAGAVIGLAIIAPVAAALMARLLIRVVAACRR